MLKRRPLSAGLVPPALRDVLKDFYAGHCEHAVDHNALQGVTALAFRSLLGYSVLAGIQRQRVSSAGRSDSQHILSASSAQRTRCCPRTAAHSLLPACSGVTQFQPFLKRQFPQFLRTLEFPELVPGGGLRPCRSLGLS